jgi:hypothetical protein
MASVLGRAGLPESRAVEWQHRVQGGAVLLGVHVRAGEAALMASTLLERGADEIQIAQWQ